MWGLLKARDLSCSSWLQKLCRQVETELEINLQSHESDISVTVG